MPKHSLRQMRLHGGWYRRPSYLKNGEPILFLEWRGKIHIGRGTGQLVVMAPPPVDTPLPPQLFQDRHA